MIGRFFAWLFDTHRHEWETIDKGQWKCGHLSGNYYDCRCKVCGKIREFKT